LAEEFLEYSDDGHVVDDRLKLNKVKAVTDRSSILDIKDFRLTGLYF